VSEPASPYAPPTSDAAPATARTARGGGAWGLLSLVFSVLTCLEIVASLGVILLGTSRAMESSNSAAQAEDITTPMVIGGLLMLLCLLTLVVSVVFGVLGLRSPGTSRTLAVIALLIDGMLVFVFSSLLLIGLFVG
jgi:hypothetical protein